jgi:hypothetical protein
MRSAQAVIILYQQIINNNPNLDIKENPIRGCEKRDLKIVYTYNMKLENK